MYRITGRARMKQIGVLTDRNEYTAVYVLTFRSMGVAFRVT